MAGPDRPPRRPRRVFLASAGATPQVITETLYALARQPEPWWPQRIIIVTTGDAAGIFRNGHPARGVPPLLGAQGKLAAMARALGHPLADGCVSVVVPARPGAGALRDVRSREETEQFADTLFRIIAELTADATTELHVSLAGGRKSMSFIAGQVMSLLGRPQDQLSHVLVEPAGLESNPEFWWPGDGSPGAATAVAGLHQVPYLRVRAWMDVQHLLPGNSGFASAVACANRLLGPARLCVDLDRQEVVVAGVAIACSPRQIAALALVALARLQGLPLQMVTGWNPDDRKERGFALGGDRDKAARLWAWFAAAADIRQIYRDSVYLSDALFGAAVKARLATSDYSNFGAEISRLRKRLARHLPEHLATRVLAPRSLETGFAPEDLSLVIPPELAAHPDRPAGVMVSSGSSSI